MLKQYQMPEKPSAEELKRRMEAAREKLFAYQMQLKEHKLPVLVLMEGWGTAGKGKRHENLDCKRYTWQA